MNEVPMTNEHNGVPIQPPRRGRAAAAFGLGIVLAIGAGALAWFLVRGQEKPVAPPAPIAAPAPAPVAEQPKTAPIEGTDPSLLDWAKQVSSAEVFTPFLSAGDVARRIVAVMFTISEGQSPRALLTTLAPHGEFAVERKGPTLVIAPDAYHRYDAVAQGIGQANVQVAARAFNALEPVLESAHREIAPPGRTVRQTLLSAIDQLLAVPVPREDVQVREKGALYEYVDPKLEALTPAQKHLLRFGPENQRAVQQTLRQLKSALQ